MSRYKKVGRTKHHLIPKQRTKHIVLILDWERHHTHWHALFGNRTIYEAIEVLERIRQMKKMPEGFRR